MYFKSTCRFCQQTGHYEGYYRLVESYRNLENRVCHRTLINIGFLPEATPEQLNKIQGYLNLWHEQKQNIFGDDFLGETDVFVRDKTEEYWNRLVKEKRNDCKLVVLALVVNVEGFIKYFTILEGNIADSKTLSMMIDKLICHTVTEKAVVVIDAGIATEENLAIIRSKGYHYVCVSRSKIKDYEAVKGKSGVLKKTRSNQQIELQAVRTERNTDYYLRVKSPMKAVKETGMKNAFEERFEQELEKISQSLTKKNGTKQTDKVYRRIGRAQQKYPSVSGYYDIETVEDTNTNTITKISWSRNALKNTEKEQQLGVYFIRTDLQMNEEGVL